VTRALVIAILLMPSVAQAQSVEIRDGEVAVATTFPWRTDASYVLRVADVPLWFHAQISPEAEGGGVSIGARPTLAIVDDYRLIWASRVGPIAYGRDGASLGVEAVTELLNVFGAGEVRFALIPHVDFAGVGGDQRGWRVRTTLALALGLVKNAFSVWLGGEAGYAFGADGPGAFRLAGTLTIGVRPEAFR